MGRDYLINDIIAAEILKQNWEAARYHESSRWKYTYYYYFGLGAFLIYILNAYKNVGFDIFGFSSTEFLFYGIIFIILSFIGYASFFHLLYSNMEYKNHIRSVEYMARDLGVNINISNYRNGDKNISRSAYMALPLMIGIRKKMPFTMLTGSAIAIALGLGIFYLTIFITKIFATKCFLYRYHMVYPLSIPALGTAIVVIVKAREFWKNTENLADIELKKRDPQLFKL